SEYNLFLKNIKWPYIVFSVVILKIISISVTPLPFVYHLLFFFIIFLLDKRESKIYLLCNPFIMQ
ncbi:hypothetical protein, partial [Flavobacterium sp.]|uniref:hypothetical protein n=1 Tax=Flavobacterium sp. TaxID=239 RepID=UPI0025B92F9F